MWPNIGRLAGLRDEIDALFESPLAELARSSRLLSGWTPALDLDEDKVKAHYRDGVLTITLPTTEEAKPKHIDINVNG